MCGLLLDGFGCGLDLRKGALLVAYVQMIIEIIVGTLLIMYPYGDNPRDSYTIEDYEGIMILILSLTFTITLIRGLHLNKRSRIKTYLIFSIMLLVLILTHVAMGKLEFPILKEVFLMIYMYIQLVVGSYFYQMDKKEIPDSTQIEL